MPERVILFRPLTGELLHPDVEWETGSDTQRLNEPGSIDFTLPISWQNELDSHSRPILGERATLVAVGTGGGRNNMQVRQVGLLDDLLPVGTKLHVSAGGLSMQPAQSGPWEGHQGVYESMDVMTLFRRLFEQAQNYANADVGLQVIGDSRTGTPLGDPGSARWRNADRRLAELTREMDRWEARVVARERELAQREERVFRASGLKRVGQIHVTDDGSNPPDDPGYKADSTVWVRVDNKRAYRWQSGKWVARTIEQNQYVAAWLAYRNQPGIAKDEVARLKYLAEPHQQVLEEHEDEARETYGLFFWQNHDLQPVMEELMEMGPIEYRETSTWQGERLVPQIEARKKIGVRRDNILLELGVNVLDYPPLDRGETYTGVTVFGAGEGSETLSAQRSWQVRDAVRNIKVEVDKEAHTKSLTRAAAAKLERELKKAAGLGFTNLVVHHGEACPKGSFQVGDEIPVTGVLADETPRTEWVRVLSITRAWGSDQSEIEVEAI